MRAQALRVALPIRRGLKRSAEWLAGRWGRHRLGPGQPSLWILMYHRVLPTSDPRFAAEEPGMIVTPATFRRHLQELKTLFTLMPLVEWIERSATGKALPPRSCSVTFDDGWLDNYEYALPILEQEQTPATIFAVSHMIGTHREFWPNRLARILLSPDLAPEQRLNHPALKWLPGLDAEKSSAVLSPARIAHIIDSCKRFSDAEISARLDQIETALRLQPSQSASLLNWDQMRAMQKSGLIDFGSHTCNHYRLVAQLDAATMAREIAESKQLLEEQLARPVALFCYPNGDVSPDADRLVRQHYRAAVTTHRGINASGVDEHRLARIGIHEDVSATATSFQARLSGWL